MDIKQILQDFVNEPYENLVNMARAAFADIKSTFEEVAPGVEASTLLVALFATSLAVDGKLTELECKFVSELFDGVTYEETKQLVEAHHSAEMVQFIDEFVDGCPLEIKSKLLTLCCCFLAVDETISRDEVAFVYKLCEN
jgi:hypothetical protein